MSVTAVVARYREDLDWLPRLGLPAVVYDKSGDPPEQILATLGRGATTAAAAQTFPANVSCPESTSDNASAGMNPPVGEALAEAGPGNAAQPSVPARPPVPSIHVAPLPNIGREAHSYLTHILRTYPDFPRHTVFLQGHPFDHLAQHGGDTELLAQRIAEAVERDRPFTGLAWFRLQCDGLGRPHQMLDESHRGRWAGWGRDIPVARVFEELFAAAAPERFVARGAAGNFVVRADRILARPLSFYQRALELVLADPRDELNTGHAFERLWHLIFNGNTRWNRE